MNNDVFILQLSLSMSSPQSLECIKETRSRDSRVYMINAPGKHRRNGSPVLEWVTLGLRGTKVWRHECTCLNWGCSDEMGKKRTCIHLRFVYDHCLDKYIFQVDIEE
jgi:hypothetical protein